MGMYGGSDGSSAARKQESERQGKIAQGMQQINATFDGGNYGHTAASVYEPGRAYYLADGNPYRAPASMPNDLERRNQVGRVMGLPQSQDPQSPDAMIKAGKLFLNKGSGGGFGPDFYAQRAKAYQDFAMPQFGKEYRHTRDNLTFQMARQGLLGSGAAIERGENLEEEKMRRQQDIANTGLNEANQLRQSVEQNRAQLVAQLQASGDPTSASQLAMRAADSYRAPSAFAPIGNMFSDWSNIYMANQGAQAQGDPNAPKWPMAFGGSNQSSSRIVR